MASWLDGVLDSGRVAVARHVAQFAEARNAILADNIANIDTPYYKVRDLSVAEFQEMLGRAIDETGGSGGPLRLESSANIEVSRQGDSLEFKPVEREDANILFHDGNNRSIEQEMSELAKNALMHRTAIEILRGQYNTLEMAIRGKF
ncbi:MAG: flagellar basal body rod protein FlgB [Planctomycetes bacterium]|nr:flagellar basal body rod protein FlgB [Planctomycetota bacterium]